MRNLPQERRLALTICAALALHLGTASATDRSVSNCTDHGAGSLRAIVGVAQSGDIVDMAQLTPASPGCSQSTITLTTGAITVPQNSLTLVGPSDRSLTITGQTPYLIEPDRIVDFTGSGTLTIGNLNLEYGNFFASGKAAGGCIYSYGNLRLVNSSVRHCQVYSDGLSMGGGIYSKGYTTIEVSTVADNYTRGNNGRGGGIFAYDDLTIANSTISGNSARSETTTSEGGAGGGVAALIGDVVIRNSTFSDNEAYSTGGGLFASTDGDVTIVNSTFYHNEGLERVGGIYAKSPHVTIDNSTIALNLAFPPSSTEGIGLFVTSDSNAQLTLNSTILSGNIHLFGLGEELDLDGSNVTTTGAGNLVRFHSISVPAGTLTGCPLLSKLKDHGGSTLTMALYGHSPAIDHGNNVYSPSLTTDQRGSPHDRQSGSAPDIGAFEVDRDDIVFDSSFEGC